jgi:hypothetical protein
MQNTQATPKITTPLRNQLIDVKIDLAEEFSRLSTRIERGRGPRNLQVVSVVLSNGASYKGRKNDGTHTGVVLERGLIMLDGFLGVFNEITRNYDGMDFADHINKLVSGTQSLDFKIDQVRDAIKFIQNL